MRKKLLMFGTLLLATFSVAGCSSSSSAPHGGLVPDVSGPTTLISGEEGSFNFDSSSAQGHRLSYSVNWGDGSKPLFAPNVSSSSSVSADHTWAQSGTYTITATATDGYGQSGFSTYTIQVNLPPPPEN